MISPRWRLAAESLVNRIAFCSQGEHKRETVTCEFAHLVRVCLDCGYRTELGSVTFTGTNRRRWPSLGRPRQDEGI